MEYITPKTNWVATDIPVESDLIRIEGNTEANHDAVIAEAIARDAAIAVAVSGLANIDFSSGESGVYGEHAISAGARWIVPTGFYFISVYGPLYMSMKKSDGNWNDSGSGGLFLSDGVNFSINNPGSSTYYAYYRKLA
jgi:hypothetical protein